MFRKTLVVQRFTRFRRMRAALLTLFAALTLLLVLGGRISGN